MKKKNGETDNMGKDKLEVIVYGTGIVCASCVKAPTSEETASWLESLLLRKYGEQVIVRYVDFQHPKNEKEREFAKKIILEDIWYPAVVINDEIITEGNPNIKKIFNKIEEMGIHPVTNFTT